MEAGMKAWHDIADILEALSTRPLQLAADRLREEAPMLSQRIEWIMGDIKTMQRIAGVEEESE